MFGKRFHVTKFLGFDIGVDISWFFIAILLSWTLAAAYFPFLYKGLSAGSYLTMGILGMLGLFISVLLHELGHAIVARRFQMPISRITLFLFGGIAELKGEPPSPKAEFWVAIAGPLVSLAIALFMTLLTYTTLPLPLMGVISYLAFINFVIVVFNMMPAFPLDGGRIFRSFIWWLRGNLEEATQLTTRMGTLFGFSLIFMGFFLLLTGNIFIGFWWALIGLFLNQAAVSSRMQFYLKRELEGEPVERFMTKDPIAAPASITLKGCIDEYMYRSHHHLYPVVEGGKLQGYISLKEIKAVPQADWDRVTVGQAMVPLSQLKTVDPKTSALKALDIIQEAHTPTLLVADGDKLVGILTAQDLFKLISLKIQLEGKN